MLANMRKGVLEPCVLALLSREELYGVDLAHRLADAGLLASEGTLYPLLARLRKSGLVASRWEESPSGPPRRYYSATAEGRAAAEDFGAAWDEFAVAVARLLEGKES